MDFIQYPLTGMPMGNFYHDPASHDLVIKFIQVLGLISDFSFECF
jgi:hypothetical protein